MNSNEDKFSKLDEDVAVKSMTKFVYYLANRYHDPNNPMMAADEIAGELFFELAKSIERYGNLPLEKFKAVTRRMMDNRISELKYKYYVTHRKGHKNEVSIEMLVAARDESQLHSGMTEVSDGIQVDELIGGNDTEALYASADRVVELHKRLSPIAKEIFDALIFGNDRLNDFIELSIIRAEQVYKNFTVKIKPYMLANALVIPESEVRSAMKEIEDVYAEVCNG